MKKCDDCEAKKNGIFCDINPEKNLELSKFKVMNHYKKGQNLFIQGHPPLGLFCVASGKIKLTINGSDGKESILKIVGAGDILGHSSLFNRKNHEASAEVIEDSIICFVDKNYFRLLLSDNHQIAIHLLEKISNELGYTEKKHVSMLQKNIRERLAGLLLQLGRDFGEEESLRIKIKIQLSRNEMASMVGAAHESIIRLLSEFREEEIIDFEGKFILIKNLKKLREIAKGISK
jgi:CRP-like cAMP-binding protein